MWQLRQPAGGVDAGESVEAAGLRELEEETSITNVRIVGSVDRWLCYDFPPAVCAALTVHTTPHIKTRMLLSVSSQQIIIHFTNQPAQCQHQALHFWQP